MRVTGQAYTNTGNGNFSILSDARYKDIHGPFERGLDDILNINTVKFNYIVGNPLGSDPTKEYVGVTAQNLQQAIPEAVQEEKNGYLTVNTSPVLWTLLNAIKDVYHRWFDDSQAVHRDLSSTQADVAQLKAENAAKDRDISTLKQDNAALKQDNAALKQDNAALKQDNAALKEAICQLNPNAKICNNQKPTGGGE
jgi:hypothetical protein